MATDLNCVIASALGIQVDCITSGLEYQSIAAWDSLHHAALMIALEKHFDVKIDDDLMLELHSVAAIHKFACSLSLNALKTDRIQPVVVPEVAVCRGLEGVYVDRSTITKIDRDAGALEYRGYNIHDLVLHSTFEETAWLLIHSELPSRTDFAGFKQELASNRTLPDSIVNIIRLMPNAHPMDVLRTCISALGAFLAASGDETPETALPSGIRLIAQTPTVIAAHNAVRTGRTLTDMPSTGSLPYDFLRSLMDREPTEAAVRFIQRDMIVHADHSSNASAFAARIAIGCRSNIYAAITAAIGAFAGSVHGGAVAGVMTLIDDVGSPENAEAYVRDCQTANRPVMGFGHRVYRREDPRVRPLRDAAWELSVEQSDTRSFDIVEAVVQAMLPYASHGVSANVDLYAGLAYRLLGLPDDLAVSMFAAARMAGWVAQSLEQLNNNVLIRPLLHYVGPESRPYPGSQR